MEMSPLIFLGVLLIGLFANIIGHTAGGGTGLITIPVLIFFGLPPQSAVATVKLTILGGIPALGKYIKHKKVKWEYLIFFVSISILATFVGTKILLSIPADFVQKTIGVIILLMIPIIILKNNLGLNEKVATFHSKTIGFILFTILAIVQASFGSVGQLVTMTLVMFFGYTIIQASATRRIPLMVLNIIAFIIYAFSGLVYYWYALALAIGQSIGGYIGAHMSVTKGDAWVRRIFIALLLVLSIKLLVF